MLYRNFAGIFFCGVSILANFIEKVLDSVKQVLDTPEEVELIRRSKPNETKIRNDFQQYLSEINARVASRFWMWLAFVAEGIRLIINIERIKTDSSIGEMQIYYIILCSVVIFVTLLTLIPIFLTRKNPAKYCRVLQFAVDTYMLIYLVRAAFLTMADASSGIISFSLIVAFFIAGYTLYIRPASAVFNTLFTFAVYTGFTFYADLWNENSAGIFLRVGIVAVLSCITAIARHHSKYKAFLNERSMNESKKELEALNDELEYNKEKIEMQNRRLQFVSSKDMLTGISNRRSFTLDSSSVLDSLCKAERFLTIAIIDVDEFKHINDTYGHIAGDACLATIGKVFREIESDDVTCYRFGGDEFVVLFNNMSRSEAFLIMQRIAKEVSCLKFDGFEQIVTLSAGIYSEIPTADMTIDHFIEKADKLLYKAKNEGKNRIEY